MDVTLLLPTQQQNEMALLHLLNNASPSWLSKDELATHFSLPISTIQKNYRQLESRLLMAFPKLALEVNTTLGYRINQNINTHLGAILLSYLQDAPLFNLLSAAFDSQPFNATLFAESFDISRATYYREVSNLNGLLNAYGISFDSKSGKLIGQRHLIRQFAQHFFWSAYKNNEFPLAVSQDLAPLFSQLEEVLYSPLNSVTQKKIRFSLTVSFLDMRQGFYLEKPLLHSVSKEPLFQVIHTFLSGQFYLLNPNIIENESQFIYQLLLTGILSLNTTVFSKSVVTYFSHYEPASFAYVTDILTELKGYPSLLHSDEETLAFKADLLISLHQVQTSHSERTDMNNYSLDYFSQHYCSLYSGLITLFQRVEKQTKQPEKNSAIRFKALVSAIETGFDLMEFERDFKIQVISERSHYSKKIKRELKRYSQHKISFSDELPTVVSPDLIITDTRIDSTHSALLYHISYPPRATDWQEINQLMAKIG
ncbi:helix-turn-helix domain-containing protein [uncultured Vagococcus sp.]|uniref:helix-turn-helix domain-containing protein n=1 Tax=uncultured Vagococcus sp. TaxID=189676 RepID=UPI0028D736D0|nr:helix-turn-helix domain-containing protein [uncultured Vagococcus sp.]